MRLNEFEQHPIWQHVEEIEVWLQQIADQDDGRSVDAIDELRVRVAQLRAVHRVRRRLAPLIVPAQLAAIDSPLQSVWNALNSGVSTDLESRAQYVHQAMVYAQEVAVAVGRLPSASPTGAEERLEVSVVDACSSVRWRLPSTRVNVRKPLRNA